MCAALGADLNAQAFVDPSLALVAYDSDMANLTGVGHVRTAVRLQVEAHDVHDADLVDRRGQEVDLGADQVRDLEGLLARERLISIARAAATSALMRASTSLAKSADICSSSKSMRAARGVMLPPVTCAS